MKPLSAVLLSFLCMVSASAEGGATLTVKVTNIPGAKGQLLVGVFDGAGSFTSRPLPGSPRIPVTSTAPVTVRIPGLKPGTYAVAVIQDLNGNGVLDRSPLGMPQEPLAFSVVRKIPRGKPSFAACSFRIGHKNVSMTIPLVVK